MSQERETRSPERAASPERRSPPRSRSPEKPRSRSPPPREDRGGGRDRRDGRRPGTSLLVRNLSYQAERRDLLQHFEKFQAVDAHVPLDYHTRQPRGFGFVEFESRDDAMDALRDLDETELMGRTIRIIEAKGNRKSADEMKTDDRPRRDDRRERDSYRRRSRSPRRRSPPRDDRYDYRSGGGNYSRDRRSRSR